MPRFQQPHIGFNPVSSGGAWRTGENEHPVCQQERQNTKPAAYSTKPAKVPRGPQMLGSRKRQDRTKAVAPMRRPAKAKAKPEYRHQKDVPP